MSALPQEVVTEAEYLAAERAAETRSELVNGQVYAMAGASYEHNVLTANTLLALGLSLRGKPCRPLASDQRIKIEATGSFVYADASVVCGPPQFDDSHHDTLLNPTVVLEVLSPSTERYDRGAKFAHYRRLESLKVYLLVAQDQMLVERYVRQGEHWVLTEFTHPGATIELAALGCSLTLGDLYEGVDLTQVTGEAGERRGPRS